jgi:hypothetical protein
VKKSLFAIALPFVFAAAAVAGPVAFNTPSDSKVITVNATIQQSVSCTLTASEVNFNVTDPSVATNGDTSVGINCKASLAKGHNAVMSIASSDLIGALDGKHIPAAAILGATNNTQGAYYTLDPGQGGFYPFGLYANNGGVSGETGGITLSLQLAPDATRTPDQYTGTVTVLMQVQ